MKGVIYAYVVDFAPNLYLLEQMMFHVFDLFSLGSKERCFSLYDY